MSGKKIALARARSPQSSANMDLKKYLEDRRVMVEEALADLLPPDENLQHDLSRHLEAMRYSLMAGGKRVRPILCLAACEAVGGETKEAMPVALALECIHTYSLIHDDLPAMDNDDLRRGLPTNHKVFGEANAILAGDSLLTLAFETLSGSHRVNLSPEIRLQIVNLIAAGSGPLGMVGGQAIDIACEGKSIDFETLREIHRRKTGALITAAVQSGALVGRAMQAQFESLTSYGELIGLSFQIVDDLLNVEGTTTQLGKAAGSDVARGKATYPSLFGVEETRRLAEETVNQAVSVLADLGPAAEPLRQLALYIKNRTQ